MNDRDDRVTTQLEDIGERMHAMCSSVNRSLATLDRLAAGANEELLVIERMISQAEEIRHQIIDRLLVIVKDCKATLSGLMAQLEQLSDLLEKHEKHEVNHPRLKPGACGEGRMPRLTSSSG